MRCKRPARRGVPDFAFEVDWQLLSFASHRNFHQGFFCFEVAAVAVPVGPPGGSVGNLIVGVAVGFGGKSIRTVSFLGCAVFESGSSGSAAAVATFGPRGGLGGGTSGLGFGSGWCSSFIRGAQVLLTKANLMKGLFTDGARLA